MSLLPLTKEHILMRNQNLVGFKLPELSEAAEQDKGRLGGPVCPPKKGWCSMCGHLISHQSLCMSEGNIV